jgi:hypothetical protein
MWRQVMRPLLFRPPVFFRVTTNDFSGFALVISSKAGNALNREVGVNGLNVFIAILRELYCFTLRQSDDRLLPVVCFSSGSRPRPFGLPIMIAGVYSQNFFSEERLDRLSNLRLVCGHRNLKHVLAGRL